MALITQSDFEARIGRSLSATEVTSFTLINAALQAYVERLIGSSVESASLTTRYYNGGRQHTPIDPCTDISDVKQVDDDSVSIYTYDTTDYQTYPANKTVKYMIIHRSGPLVRGINNIAVRAKFSIYADEGLRNIVKDAMLNALTGEMESSENIKSESIEGYSVEYASTEARNSLDRIQYLFPGL